jgi:hypothetical protein
MIDELKKLISQRYDVKPDGVVINKKTNKELKFHRDDKGYLKTRIYCPELSNNADKRKPIRLHRLVAMFYLDSYDEKLQVNHKNGIKIDNRVDNLEMVTNSQNAYHAWNVLDSTDRKNKLNQKRGTDGRFN